MIKKLFVLAVLSANALFAQRYERLIETRTISNHEIVGAEHDAASNSLFILSYPIQSTPRDLVKGTKPLPVQTLDTECISPQLVFTSADS